jgi:hypothetical protein
MSCRRQVLVRLARIAAVLPPRGLPTKGDQARFLRRPEFGTAIGVIFNGPAASASLVFMLRSSAVNASIMHFKTSSFFEGVEICLAASDRIEKRFLRIEGASGLS